MLMLFSLNMATSKKKNGMAVEPKSLANSIMFLSAFYDGMRNQYRFSDAVLWGLEFGAFGFLGFVFIGVSIGRLSGMFRH